MALYLWHLIHFADIFIHSVPTSAPTNPIGTATNARTIRLSWGEPPSNQQNGIIREYRVNITEVATGRVFQRVSTTTSIEITSLHPFYVYEWTVSAFTVGEGPYSSISTITTPEDGKLTLVLCAPLIFHLSIKY